MDSIYSTGSYSLILCHTQKLYYFFHGSLNVFVGYNAFSSCIPNGVETNKMSKETHTAFSYDWEQINIIKMEGHSFCQLHNTLKNPLLFSYQES